ncbi:MAG: cation:proton antiporter [Fretibacterium sp.]|nr:cation:proton antiporter [Fretibacterium sp.]
MSAGQYLFLAAALWAALLLFFVLLKLLRFPSDLDRLVAFDLFHTLASLMMLLLAAVYDSRVLLDATLVYILTSFVATLCFARYLGGKIE